MAGPLVQRDGADSREHPIEEFYFDEMDPDGPHGFRDRWCQGPLLDVGAGTGRDALYFQERFETVALEVSDSLVTVMDVRGVTDTRLGDMFALGETFPEDRFGSVLVIGTQLGLAASMAGLRSLLADLAHVTRQDGIAVVDAYDPTTSLTAELLGYRDDPAPGLAFRVMHFEYAGEVGETLLFRLFSPDRLEAAAAAAGWELEAVDRVAEAVPHYRAALAKP